MNIEHKDLPTYFEWKRATKQWTFSEYIAAMSAHADKTGAVMTIKLK